MVNTTRDFRALTGWPPLKWQQRLFDRLVAGNIPAAIDLPTGLGKTSVMAIWYLARRNGATLPRRLVYVVDRRAVVDQATEDAVTIKSASGDEDLRISTLRGQHVDNREWLNDPATTAIIVGTIDMIGSRLLFEGYGVSRKMRPYHAGLLGADTLVVLDEAHLVPPFEKLLEAIEGGADAFGAKKADDSALIPRFRLMSLSATGRERKGEAFRLDSEDLSDPVVVQRLNAKKAIEVVACADRKLEDALADEGWRLSSKGERSIRCLIYCDSREVGEKTKDALDKRARGDKKSGIPKVDIDTELFVGARRVRERERARQRLKELGFIGGKKPERAAFLIATSAGEVGVDMDADHMACDLVPWERMVQRLGRVNRRGAGEANVAIVDEGPPPKPKRPENPTRHERLKEVAYRALAVVRKLPRTKAGLDASPGALRALKLRAAEDSVLCDEIDAATTPAPLRPALTRALVDAWSMTSLDGHTGRPEIEPWLRGWIDDDPPQTNVVWRHHLPIRKDGVAPDREATAFFEAAPPHASEMLETETHRVVEWLIARSVRLPIRDDIGGAVAFVLGPADDFRKRCLLDSLRNADKRTKDQLHRLLASATLIVDAKVGGLSVDGVLNKDRDEPADAADGGADGDWTRLVGLRIRQSDDQKPNRTDNSWRERHRFATELSDDGDEVRWLVVEKWRDATAGENDRAISRKAQSLVEHESWTEQKAIALAKRLDLPPAYRDLLAVSARLHDEGKRNPLWQRAFNAKRDGEVYAKTEGPVNARLLGGYRHEFGSLPYAEQDERWRKLPEYLRDLALHLIAAHHGFARPVIDTAGCYDAPPSALEERAAQVALRFARLQKQWGPWGLAWWEALLRAADQQASRENDERGGNE